MDRLAAMECFVAVVETGSISAAAARLGVGQPAVSKTLAALEAHLRVPLLIRSTRGSALTEAGRRYLAHARTTLDEADQAEAAARNEAVALRGELHVAAPPGYANAVLIPRLAEFRARHPGILLDLILDDRRIDLIAGGIDLALRGGRIEDSAIIARRIDQPRRIVVTSRRWLEGRAAPGHPRELLAHDFIAYAPWRATAWAFTRNGANETVTFPPALCVSSADALRLAVHAGLGCAIVSDRMVHADLGGPELVRLLPEWELPSGEMWLLSPAGRRISARARAFGAWLDEVIADLAKAQPRHSHGIATA
jgi:DNA-binding transcriptional LysR family regulator